MSLLKKLKEYNYYDDEAVYSDFYIFVIKIRRLALHLLRSAVSFAAGAAKYVFAKIRKKDASDNGCQNPPEIDFKLQIKKAQEFFKDFSANETALKATASLMVVVFVFSFIIGYAVKINGFSAKEEKFCADAGAVCTKLMSGYGVGRTEKILKNNGEDTGLYRITGLAFARQMDFDADGSPELLVCYEDGGIYFVEVWGYSRGEFVKFYSDSANTDSENAQVGSFVTISHKGSKYRLGKLGKTKDNIGNMEILEFSGKKFKSAGVCDYDAQNDIYAVKGKINSTEFETVRFSFITPVRAERTVEATLKHLDNFKTLNIQEIENAKTEEEKMADAYYDIVEKYNQKYGKAEIKTEKGINFVNGLAVVRQLDFNGDGVKELMLVYRYNKKVSSEDRKGNMVLLEEPTYYMEIFAWNGKKAKLVYENDGLSQFKDNKDDEIFFILMQDEKAIKVCSNSYEYGKSSRVWKAASHISAMNENGVFENVFNAVANCNYDYMTYSINGEKVYKQEFKEKGYEVPYFCNEDEFDNSKFSVTVLQSSGQKISQGVVNDTVSQIKILNERYTA